MLVVTKSQLGSSLVVQMRGNIDDMIDFAKVIGPVTSQMVIKCRDVSRINSIGVKQWRKYFGEVRAAGTRVRFAEVSTALVEQMNFISDFIPTAELESICTPYFCTACEAEQVRVYPLAELRSANLSNLTTACPKCEATLEFDEIPELYFAFLKAERA